MLRQLMGLIQDLPMLGVALVVLVGLYVGLMSSGPRPH